MRECERARECEGRSLDIEADRQTMRARVSARGRSERKTEWVRE